MKKLKAGDLDVYLDGTQLRYIQANGFEVVRGIYAALRNENWDTIIPEVSIVSFTESVNAFYVEMKAVYRNETLHFAIVVFECGTQCCSYKFWKNLV